ncbi:hypothetical protein [Halorubrum kocurii]|uniref:Glycerophosphoryl diester phosphodiesterase membrane domain-containing protein n=1 Tax=Halorubrum kocurii JCM 14978 TaxID=1230456 RepID=M0NM09_9EURY|nr:hypothetical protein [Halorubrum kocurii]EMA58982.1 hypothetical protein C468_15122 [Halorubrum kocurii JCM 14978]
MAQPSGSPRDDAPSPPEPIFERTFAHVSRLLPLALVPLATALLNVSDLLATARMDGFSVRASFPVYRYDLWSFVESPDHGGLSVSVPFGTLESLPVLVPLLGAYVVVSGVLSAGYFGSIADGLTTGRFDFVAGVRRFAVRMVVLEALVVVALAAVFLPLVVVPPLFVVAVLAVLALSYLFFPTVYVLVLEDRGIESAARRARELVRRQQPIGFFLFVAVVTAICSVPVSLLAHAGAVGAVLAAIVAAPLGLAFNVATALKVAEMAGVETIE